MGYLADKPKILVTHQLQYLTDADHIIALSDVCYIALLNLLPVLFTLIFLVSIYIRRMQSYCVTITHLQDPPECRNKLKPLITITPRFICIQCLQTTAIEITAALE